LEEPDQVVRLAHQLRLPPNREPSAQVEAELHGAAVLRTLNSLPERYALALEAKYGDGLSVEEIAAMLGVTTIAAQSLLARAREAFRDLWLANTSAPPDVAGQHE
jgi:RNA polymerase sigma-70 factor (ECF subfamily)